MENLTIGNFNIKSLSRQQKLLLLAMASVCMPFMITAVVAFATVIILLFDKQTRQSAFLDKADCLLYAFGGLLVVVPLCYKRYISVFLGVIICLGILLFLFLKVLMTKELMLFIMHACCASSVICFVIGIAQKLINGPHFRATGGLLNANYYGTICEFIIVFAVYLIITNKQNNQLGNNREWIGFYTSILVINIAGIFLCDCQSAWIAVMAAIFCLLFFGGRKKIAYYFLGTAFVLLLVGVLTPGLLPRLDAMPQTYSTRQNIWQTSIKGICAHPIFGQGAMTYMFSHSLYEGSYATYHAHSIYLDPLLSYGIVGTGILIAYTIISLRRLFLEKDKMVIALVLSVVVCALIHGITDNTLFWIQTAMLMMFCISTIYIGKNKRNMATKWREELSI